MLGSTDNPSAEKTSLYISLSKNQAFVCLLIYYATPIYIIDMVRVEPLHKLSECTCLTGHKGFTHGGWTHTHKHTCTDITDKKPGVCRSLARFKNQQHINRQHKYTMHLLTQTLTTRSLMIT